MPPRPGTPLSFRGIRTNPPAPGQTLAAADEGHGGGGDRQELDVGVQGEAGHEQDCLCHVPGVERRLRLTLPSAWRAPAAIHSVISVAALPMSIWPQAMPNGRPSSEIDLVSPVIACLVAV